jgi:hypothetical protein
LRDYLFGADGRFATSMPTGWAWGPAELDPTRFLIIRTAAPEWEAAKAALERREKLLDSPGLWQSGNVYSAGSLKTAPEAEWMVGKTWTNLSTGRRYAAEEDAWADAKAGDTLHVRSGNDPDCPGVAVLVTDADSHQGLVQKNVTAAKAEEQSAALVTGVEVRRGPA